MNFTVAWKPAAEAKLATLWADPDHRRAIAEAANTIDGLLRRDPLGCGESREENSRILLVPPLGELYEVSEPDRTVSVDAVWWFSPKHNP